MAAHVPHTDEANARLQLVAFCIHYNTSFCNITKRHAIEMCCWKNDQIRAEALREDTAVPPGLLKLT
jgi:hypothetical protein